MRRSNRECDREEKKTSNRGRWAKANETFGVSVGCVYENRTNNCFYSIACPPHDETKNEYQNKYDGSVCRDGPNGATAGEQTRLINGDNAIRSMKYQMSRPIVLLCVSVCVCVRGGSLGGVGARGEGVVQAVTGCTHDALEWIEAVKRMEIWNEEQKKTKMVNIEAIRYSLLMANAAITEKLAQSAFLWPNLIMPTILYGWQLMHWRLLAYTHIYRKARAHTNSTALLCAH